MKLSNEQMERLQLITLYNEHLLARYEGDQGAAVGLITFCDESQGIDIWNPFYDSSLRYEVEPTEEYTEEQLLSMLEQLLLKEEVNTGGNCIVDFYKVNVESEVKCIGVTDDCIIGFAELEPYLVEVPTEVWLVHRSEDTRYV